MIESSLSNHRVDDDLEQVTNGFQLLTTTTTKGEPFDTTQSTSC